MFIFRLRSLGSKKYVESSPICDVMIFNINCLSINRHGISVEEMQKNLCMCDILCFSIPNQEAGMGKSKTIVPQNSSDRMLFAFMVVGIPFGVAWLGGVIMPHYHRTIDSTVVMHIACATFIFYNIFHNMLLVIRVDASGRTSYLPSVLKPGNHDIIY